ncbi:unnamed protein product [Ixodes persulcatus]
MKKIMSNSHKPYFRSLPSPKYDKKKHILTLKFFVPQLSP